MPNNYFFRVYNKTFKNIINYIIDLKNEIYTIELIEIILIITLLDFFNDKKMSFSKDYLIYLIIIACFIKTVNRKRNK